MRKGFLRAALLVLCAVIALNAAAMTVGAAALAGDDSAPTGAAYERFMGKRFSILVGSIFDGVADRVFNASEKLYFNNTVEEIEAVKLGKTDAALLDDVAAAQSLQAGEYQSLTSLPVPLPELELPYGVFSSDQDVIDEYNLFLAEIEADGTLYEMQERWLKSYAFDAVMPEIPLTGENGTLRVAIMATYPPFTFAAADGEFAGFDIEQMRRFAAWMGMDVEFIDMDFGAMMAYVASGKADIGGSVYITEERKQSFIFGDPDYVSETVLVVRLEDVADLYPAVQGPQGYADYIGAGKVFGCAAGDVYGYISETVFGASASFEYDTIADGIIALENRRVDAFVADAIDLLLPQILNESEDIEFIEVPLEVYTSNLSPLFATEQLRDSFNVFLTEIKSDGTLDEMIALWFSDAGLPGEENIPRTELTGKNGTLRATINSGNAPQGYKDSSGKYVGFSVELAERFAKSLDMDIEWIDCDMLTSLTYLQSGRSDMMANMSTKTESRMEQMIYADTVLEDHAVLVVRREGATAAARDYTWFEGKTVGAHVGSITDEVLTSFGAQPAYYQDNYTAIEDIRNGRIDGLITDLSALRVLASEPGNSDMEVIEVPESFFSGPMGAIASFDNQALIDEFNEFLECMRADGTLGSMVERWFEGVPDLDAPMPSLTYSGEKGVIRVATVSTEIPFGYMGANNELKGYAIELMNRFAADAGYIVEYQPMEFSSQIPAVTGGRADIALSSISITEERKQSVLFSNSVYDDQLGIITLKQSRGALSYEDFIGKRFAVKNGTIYDALSREVMRSSSTLFFEDYTSIYESVLNGKVDAGMRGYTAAYVSLFESAYTGLDLIALPEDLQSNPVGAISMDQDTIDTFNEFLAHIRADGTYDDMRARWLDAFDPGSIPEMPDIQSSGENGTLVVAISSDYMPFSFLGDDGVNLGFDIELARRFAAYTGKEIQFVDMAFSGLLPYVVSGKADIAVSDITITDERKESVLFTDPYFVDLSAIIYRSDFGAGAAEAEVGFVEWLKTAINRNLITENRWKMIANGLGVTMTISILAQLLGTALGCLLCWVLMRKGRFVSGLGRFISGVIHGLPMVVLLMISYYIIFGKADISAMLIAVCAFAIVEGVSVAGNLKGAIDTVDITEIEAARSIGFSAIGAFFTVTLPQAVKRALPAYCNGFVELVKATAIVGYIAIQDMTRAGDIIRSRTYDAFFPLLFVALIYLVVTTLCVQLFKLAVRKINKEVR